MKKIIYFFHNYKKNTWFFYFFIIIAVLMVIIRCIIVYYNLGIIMMLSHCAISCYVCYKTTKYIITYYDKGFLYIFRYIRLLLIGFYTVFIILLNMANNNMECYVLEPIILDEYLIFFAWDVIGSMSSEELISVQRKMVADYTEHNLDKFCVIDISADQLFSLTFQHPEISIDQYLELTFNEIDNNIMDLYWFWFIPVSFIDWAFCQYIEVAFVLNRIYFWRALFIWTWQQKDLTGFLIWNNDKNMIKTVLSWIMLDKLAGMWTETRYGRIFYLYHLWCDKSWWIKK